jgi:hypothetical protein
MRATLFVILSAAFICGCAYIPPSTDKTNWYAVLENGGPEKYSPVSKVSGTVCLKIMVKFWRPLITADGGPGGPTEGWLYWVNLTGEGPVYHDQAIHEDNGYPTPRQLGTISIDKKNKKVIIDLQQLVSKPGEPLKTEPSPANGTYRIKRWIE